MDKEIKWLKIIANLNFYKAKHGTAPHKPLLLLSLWSSISWSLASWPLRF